MELLLIVVGLALLGLAALRFGQDSRDLDAAGPWHSWREVALRGRADVSSPVDPHGVDVETAFRVERLRIAAAQERLLRPSPSFRVAGVAPHRVAVARLGLALVRLGERLQSYGRTAVPGW